jgi:hypothetical protein
MVDNVAGHAENKFHSILEGLGIMVPLEPFVALEDGDISVGLHLNNALFFLDNIESSVQVAKSPTIEEGWDSPNNMLTLSLHDTADFEGLASVGACDRGNTGLGFADIAGIEGFGTRVRFEFVIEKDEFEQVTINRLGEYGLNDGL